MSKQQAGLTLIEVLIALAIVGIALTAIVKASSQSIRSVSYLQDKTMALWVGQYILNEVRMNILKLPDPPDKIVDSLEMLDRNWYFEARQEKTPNKRIEKIGVKIFKNKNDNEREAFLINLETYVYYPEKN